MKVDVRRRRDGTVIFDEFEGMRRGEPVATVRYRMKTVAVVIAAGVTVPEELTRELGDLLEQAGSLNGAALDERVNAVDSGLDDAMQRAGVTHDEVQKALQRHPGCMSSLSETVRKVVGAVRYGVPWGEPWDRKSVGAVVEVPRLESGAAGEHGRSTVGDHQQARRQKETQRKRERKKQKKAAARGEGVRGEEVRGEGVQQAAKDSWEQPKGLRAAAAAEAEEQAELLEIFGHTLLEPTSTAKKAALEDEQRQQAALGDEQRQHVELEDEQRQQATLKN